VLGSSSFSDKAVVAWKLDSVDITHFNVGQVQFDQPLPQPSGHFGFFTTPAFELDHFPGWRPIPR
jgi:methanobactin biosynthesis cassette protein MbnC